MTTYPLSELATLYAAEAHGTKQDVVIGQGTLAECAEMIEGLSAEQRTSARIEMDELDLRFGPRETGELVQFLQQESAGLTNHDIADIAGSDS